MGRPRAARFYDRDGIQISGEQARQLSKNSHYRTVATDHIPVARMTMVELTTTWLGVDYSGDDPPKIFMTRIARGRFDGLSVRYATEVEARAGHTRALVQLLAGRPPWFIR